MMDVAKRNEAIDPAWIAAIAREVIARLKSKGESTSATAASLRDKVITVETLRAVADTTVQLFIPPGAIVTPAASDEAKERGITINRSVDLPPAQQPDLQQPDLQQPKPQQQNQQRLEIIDSQQPTRADAIRSQLKRRGVIGSGGRIVLSDSPAHDVHERCTSGERAVMVTTVADVRRFAGELDPNTWVLDMQRLNFSAAVNAAVQITQLGTGTR